MRSTLLTTAVLGGALVLGNAAGNAEPLAGSTTTVPGDAPIGHLQPRAQAPSHRYRSAAATLMLPRTATRTAHFVLGVIVPTIRYQARSLAMMVTGICASDAASRNKKATKPGGFSRISVVTPPHALQDRGDDRNWWPVDRPR